MKASAGVRIESLRWRLLVAICAAVLLLWLLTGWFSYTKAQHEASHESTLSPGVRRAALRSAYASVASLTAAGVGLNLQAASNVVLAELSWTSAEQTQAIDRVHRIGQAEPVTAWRIIAAHTIDAKIAELIDSKAGLAARALDGSDEEIVAESNIQLEALAALLRDALDGSATE